MATLDLGYKKVELYMPGLIVECHVPGETDKEWYIHANDIKWTDEAEPVQMLTLWSTDDEGDVGVDSRMITVNSDMLDIRII